VSVLYAVSFFLSEAVRWSWIAAQAVSIVMGIWALVDSLMRPAEYYAAAGKSTKRFWNVVNAAGTAVVGLLGAAEGHVLHVRQFLPRIGAGFIVALTGNVMTMPGLPKKPAAEGIAVSDGGKITGLF